jgi:hypothetical protein
MSVETVKMTRVIQRTYLFILPPKFSYMVDSAVLNPQHPFLFPVGVKRMDAVGLLGGIGFGLF